MSDVKTTLIILKEKLESMTGRPVYILDTNPTAIDKDVIYIVAPGPGDVYTKHYMSTSSLIRFPIHIYSIVHVKDVTRQKDIEENIYTSYKEADNILNKVHNRCRNWRRIGTMNVANYSYGVSSWVVNTKVFTAYEIIFRLKGILDD